MPIASWSLCMRSTDAIDSAALSCTGFATSPATIALSDAIRVAFSPVSRPDQLLSHSDLNAHDMSALEVWRAIACRHADAATATDSSSSFLVRHLHLAGLPRSVQIRVRSGRASEWLAHPLLFTRLQGCATKVLGTADALFHVLGPDCVVVTESSVAPEALAGCELASHIDPDCFFPGLSFQGGFPISMPSDTAVAPAREGTMAVLC